MVLKYYILIFVFDAEEFLLHAVATLLDIVVFLYNTQWLMYYQLPLILIAL